MSDKTKTIDVNAEAFDDIANASSEDFRSFEPAEEAQWLVGGSYNSFQQTNIGNDYPLDHHFDIW